MACNIPNSTNLQFWSEASPYDAIAGGNQSTTPMFLVQTGNGTCSTAPIWRVLTVADMPSGGSATDLVTTGASVNVSASNPPAHAGQLLISQPGNTSAIWADPLVQGLYAPGTNVNTAGGASPPIPINPVLIGGSDYSGTPLLHDVKVDTSGNLYVANGGTFATQDSNIANTIAATGAAVPSKTQQVGGSDGTDIRTFATDIQGNEYVRPAAPQLAAWSQAPISFSASGDNTIIAGVGGKTIKVMRLIVFNNGAMGITSTQLTFKDTASNLFTGPMGIVTSNGLSGLPCGEPIFTSATSAGIVINSSSAVQISGAVWYVAS